MTITDKDDAVAYKQGYVLGISGLKVCDLSYVNPYNERTERLQYRSWLAGYWEGYNDNLYSANHMRGARDGKAQLVVLILVAVCVACAVAYSLISHTGV